LKLVHVQNRYKKPHSLITVHQWLFTAIYIITMTILARVNLHENSHQNLLYQKRGGGDYKFCARLIRF